MNNQLKTHLFLIVACLAIQNCSASFLRTWTFVKNNASAANGIICRGPYCNVLDIQVVSCSGLYFDIDYQCNTPDLTPPKVDLSFSILCYGNVYRNDNCYVQVQASKEPQYNQVETRSTSILRLTMYLVLIQLLIVGVCGLAYYFVAKLLKSWALKMEKKLRWRVWNA